MRAVFGWIGHLLQAALDGFYHARRFSIDLLAFAAVRVFGIECRFSEVRARAYSHNRHADLNLDGAKDLDTLLSCAQDRHKDSLDRRAFVTDKVKTLITLNSAALAVLVAFRPRTAEFDGSWPGYLYYGALLSLFTALVVMWVYFDIKGETVVTLGQAHVGLDEADLKKSLINSHLKSQAGTDNVTDFLADLYKAARFYLLTGFLVVFVSFSISYFARPPGTEAERVVEKLRSDPKLIDLLRGPKGDRGERGSQGDRGPRGEKGMQGERGVAGEKGPEGKPAVRP